MLKRLIAGLLIISTFLLATSVFAVTPAAPLPNIEITITGGEARWDAVDGADEYTVAIWWGTGVSMRGQTRTWLDIAITPEDLRPAIIELRITAQTWSGDRLAEGSIGLYLAADGTITVVPLYDRIVGLWVSRMPEIAQRPAQIIDGRAYITMDFLPYFLNVEATFDIAGGLATFEGHGQRLAFVISDGFPNANAPVFLAFGEIWVPIRLVAEAFGLEVIFHPNDFVIEAIH